MKRFIKLVTLTLALAILPLAALADDGFGSAAVTEGQTYTLEQMLTYAMQDEYMAQAEYAAIQEAFGVTNPYANIMQAELVHQQLLQPLFEAYGIAVPENTAAQNVVIPETLAETFAIGVQAEINNIAMYEAFLAQGDVPEDVQAVFNFLIRASQSHLNAFTRGAERLGVDADAVQTYGRGGWQTDDQTMPYGNRMAAANQTYGTRMAAKTTQYGRNSAWQTASAPMGGMHRQTMTNDRTMDPANCPFLNTELPVQQSFGGGRWN
ncbi:MAG TPA: hypothetical protein PKU80_02825 [Candidatus Limiplasma sp.]|nr:hypothetical protein [Candidatus Limiplasma sp.]HRX08118.1 hypothetical protein [Candidatus Limiplasma sp.]